MSTPNRLSYITTMYIFNIHKGLRKYGLNAGLPVIYIDCGLGRSMSPEDVLRSLSSMKLLRHSWVVIRDGATEKGVSTLIDFLSQVGCRVEVEIGSKTPTPKYFTKASRWTVIWQGSSNFNLNALRKGQDMLICSSIEELSEAIQELASPDMATLGLFHNKSESSEIDLELLWSLQVRVFEVEQEDA